MESLSKLSVEQRQVIDQLADEFEVALRAGERPSIENVLETHPALRTHLLKELIAIEIELRKVAGELPSLEEYTLRFPNDQSLVEAVFLMRQSAGDEAMLHRLREHLRTHELTNPFPVLSREESQRSASQEPAKGDPDHYIRPGAIIGGRFKLLENIGQGGMGSVWVAEQQQPVKRRVAIKLIKAGMDSKEVLARFDAERQALAVMDHPNIAKVFDGGMTEQGRPYFVMEYVKGVPFTDYCDAAKLSLDERLRLFIPVCQAVQHAHHKGIVHRDLKPSNILICLYDGHPIPKVIDFGLAKALHQRLTDQSIYTGHGNMLGTPLYMSPEQAELNNLDIDTRTDIYSLGVVLYELLTGTTPIERHQFKEAAFDEILRLIKQVEPPRPSLRLSGSASLPGVAAQRSIEPRHLMRSLSGELDWIAMKALEKERHRRYETANDFARDIERYLTDLPVVARPPSITYRTKKFIKKYRLPVAMATSIVFLLVAGLLGIFWALKEAQRQTQSAIASQQETELQRQKTSDALDAAKASEAKAIEQESLAKKTLIELREKTNDASRSFLEVGLNEYDSGRFNSGIEKIKQAWDLRTEDDSLKDAYGRILVDRVTRGNRSLIQLTHDDSVESVSFTPDGECLVTKLSNGTICLSDAWTGAPIGQPVSSYRFSETSLKNATTRRIVTASLDDRKTLWNNKSGADLLQLVENRNVDLESVTFSPDGSHFATMIGSLVRVWNTETGSSIGVPMKHTALVTSISFSPDGSRLVTGSSDKTARLWNAMTCAPLSGSMKHDQEVGSVSFSPDGSRLVTASKKTATFSQIGNAIAALRIWDAETGASIGSPIEHDDKISSFRFSADGSRFMTISSEAHRLWDPKTGSSIELPPELRKVDRSISSPDGNILAVAFSNHVRLWDNLAGTFIGNPIEVSDARLMAFSPDSGVLATVNYETIHVWNTTTGVEKWRPNQSDLAPPQTNSESRVTAIAFSPDGRYLASASADKTCRLQNAKTGAPLAFSTKHEEEIVELAFSPEGSRLATASKDKTVRLWNIPSEIHPGQQWDLDRSNIGLPNLSATNRRKGQLALSLSPDGHYVTSATMSSNPQSEGSGTVQVRDVMTGASIGKALNHDSPVQLACLSHDANCIASTSTSRPKTSPERERYFAQIWDFSQGRPLGDAIECGGSVNSVVLSPDGLRLITTLSSEARLWNAQTGAPIGNPMQHEAAINSVAFSPDGNQIATASSDKTARLWAANTAEALSVPFTHDNKVDSVVFSLDGAKLATTSLATTLDLSASDQVRSEANDVVRIWGNKKGFPIGQPMQHDGRVSVQGFRLDGSRLATITKSPPSNTRLPYTFTARLWDSQTGLLVGEPININHSESGFAFSPNGIRFVTISMDRSARLRDVQTGAPVGKPIRDVWYLSFDSDGSRMTTASMLAKVQVWDTKTGELLSEPIGAHRSVSSATFNRNGSLLAVTSGLTTFQTTNIVRLWNVETGALIGEPMTVEEGVGKLAFNPDGHRLAAAASSRMRPSKIVRLWNAKTGVFIGNPLEHEGVQLVVFSPDGSCLVTRSGLILSGNLLACKIRLWDAATGEPLSKITRPNQVIASVNFSPDGSRVVTNSRIAPQTKIVTTPSLHLWDTRNGKPLIAPIRMDVPVEALKLNSDGSRLAAIFTNRTLQLFDTQIGTKIGSPKKLGRSDVIQQDQSDLSPDVFSSSPDGRQFVTIDGDMAQVWDYQTATVVGSPIKHQSKIASAFFSCDGSRLVSAGNDGTILVSDIATKTLVGKPIELGANQDKSIINTSISVITSISLSVDGRRLATATRKGAVQVWDIESGTAVGKPMKHDKVHAVRFSPDGKRLATSSYYDKTVRLWDARNGDSIGEVMTNEREIKSIAFKSDGTLLVAALADRTIRLYDGETGISVGHHFKSDRLFDSSISPRSSIAFNSDGNQVAIISEYSSRFPKELRLFDIETIGPRNTKAFVNRFVDHSTSNDSSSKEMYEAVRALQRKRTFQYRVMTAYKAMQDEDWFAAKFHLPWLLEQEPGNPLWKEMLQTATNEERSGQMWAIVVRADGSLDDYQKAYLEAIELCDADPENEIYLLRLGVALFRLGKFNEAIESLTKAVEKYSHPANFAFLAMSHLKLGNLDEAKKIRGQFNETMNNSFFQQNEEFKSFADEVNKLFSTIAE